MDTTKAIQGGPPGLPGHADRPSIGLEDLDRGAGGAGGAGVGGKLTSWLSKISSAQRQHRRGSVGFDASGGPLNRMDEDSNSGMEVISSPAHSLADQIAGIPFGRKRDISFSDIQTPGGDGDTFLLNYKRKQSVDLAASESPRGTITLSHGQGLALDTDRGTPKDSFNTLQTLQELTRTGTRDEEAMNKREAVKNSDTEDMMFTSDNDAVTVSKDPSSSIYLIDLETATDGANLKVVPKTKKFSVTSLLQSDWAQNWFFRNENPVTEDENAMMTSEEDSAEDTASRTSEEDSVTSRRLSFSGKLKPKEYRNLNLWMPQGQ